MGLGRRAQQVWGWMSWCQINNVAPIPWEVIWGIEKAGDPHINFLLSIYFIHHPFKKIHALFFSSLPTTWRHIKHTSSSGRTTTKEFLPNVSHFVLGSHTSAVDPDFSNENLAGTGFDRLPWNKDNIEGKGREEHTWGQRDEDACLLQNLTQVHNEHLLNNRTHARHWQNSKVTDYTWSMNNDPSHPRCFKHRKQTMQSGKHLKT